MVSSFHPCSCTSATTSMLLSPAVVPVGSHLHVHVQAVVEVPEPEEVGEAQGEVEGAEPLVAQNQGAQDVTVVLVTPAEGTAAPREPPWEHLNLILPLLGGDRWGTGSTPETPGSPPAP